MSKRTLNWRELKALAYANKHTWIYAGDVRGSGMATLESLRVEGYLELRNESTGQYRITQTGEYYMGWPQSEVDKLFPPQLGVVKS